MIYVCVCVFVCDSIKEKRMTRGERDEEKEREKKKKENNSVENTISRNKLNSKCVLHGRHR